MKNNKKIGIREILFLIFSIVFIGSYYFLLKGNIDDYLILDKYIEKPEMCLQVIIPILVIISLICYKIETKIINKNDQEKEFLESIDHNTDLNKLSFDYSPTYVDFIRFLVGSFFVLALLGSFIGLYHALGGITDGTKTEDISKALQVVFRSSVPGLIGAITIESLLQILYKKITFFESNVLENGKKFLDTKNIHINNKLEYYLKNIAENNFQDYKHILQINNEIIRDKILKPSEKINLINLFQSKGEFYNLNNTISKINLIPEEIEKSVVKVVSSLETNLIKLSSGILTKLSSTSEDILEKLKDENKYLIGEVCKIGDENNSNNKKILNNLEILITGNTKNNDKFLETLNIKLPEISTRIFHESKNLVIENKENNNKFLENLKNRDLEFEDKIENLKTKIIDVFKIFEKVLNTQEKSQIENTKEINKLLSLTTNGIYIFTQKLNGEINESIQKIQQNIQSNQTNLEEQIIISSDKFQKQIGETEKSLESIYNIINTSQHDFASYISKSEKSITSTFDRLNLTLIDLNNKIITESDKSIGKYLDSIEILAKNVSSSVNEINSLNTTGKEFKNNILLVNKEINLNISSFQNLKNNVEKVTNSLNIINESVDKFTSLNEIIEQTNKKMNISNNINSIETI